MEEIKAKICTKCKVELPATTNYFYKNPRNANRILAKCKECHKLQVRNHRKENKKHVRGLDKQYYMKRRDYSIKYASMKSKKDVTELTDVYIKRKISRGRNVNITPEIIEQRRLIIQLKREIGCGNTIIKRRLKTN